MKARMVIGATLGLAAFATPALAEHSVGVRMQSFADNAANRVDTWIVEARETMQAWSLRLRGAFDRVHLPGLPGLPGSPENLDAITAASRPIPSAAMSKDGYVKTRSELNAAVGWFARPQTRFGGSLYHSVESDWVGRQIGMDWSQGFAQGNTQVGVAVSHGFDRIEPEAHAYGDSEPKSRSTNDVTATWTQSLTPRLLAQVGVEANWVHGFQSNPYRQVYAGGSPLPEKHPESRFRRAAFGEISRYFSTRASLALSGRVYNDDWGVNAGSIEMRFNQYVGEHLVVRYRYRFHSQTAADFYRDEYESADGIGGYRTADYKLDAFAANLFGVRLSLPFEGISANRWVSGLVVDAKYERYFDSRSFAANVFETGFSWPF